MSFRDAESYYGVLAHECTHWTRHPSRLDRSFGRKRWGDEGYAMEELRSSARPSCQPTSTWCRSRAKIMPHYIGSWLKVLTNDKRAIFAAASHAQRAADFLNGLQVAAAREPAA